MKLNKILSLVSLVLLLSVGKNAFSMRKYLNLLSLTKKAEQDEKFTRLKRINLDLGRHYAISPCENYVVSRSDSYKDVTIYNIKNNKILRSYKHTDEVVRLDFCFSQNGNYVASWSEKEVKVFDIKNNKVVCSYKFIDEEKLKDLRDLVWNSKRLTKEEIKALDDPICMIRCVCFSQDGNYIASGAGCREINQQNKNCVTSKLEDGEVQVWDIKKNQKICSYKHIDNVKCVCFSQDGNYVASGSGPREINQNGNYIAPLRKKGGEVKVYDIENNKILCSYKHTDEVWYVRFSQDGNYIASGLRDGKIIVYDIKNNKVLYSYKHNKKLNCVYFSQDGNYVASGSGSWGKKGGEVKVYDIKNNKVLYCYEHEDGIRSVCLSQDGNYVASGSDRKKVQIYDIKNNKEICSYKHDYLVYCVCFSSDSKKLVSVTYADQIIIHQTSPKFYLNQKRHEGEKKYGALEKADKQERVGFMQNRFTEDESDFSIQFAEGEKLRAFKWLLNK